MPAVYYFKRAAVVYKRSCIAVVNRNLGKRAQHVYFRNSRRGLLKTLKLGGGLLSYTVENFVFKLKRAVLSGKHALFYALKLLGYKAFAVCKGLLSYVILRHLIKK